MTAKETFTVFEDRTCRLDLTEQQTQELLSLEPLWGRQNLLLRADNRILLKKYVGFIATPNLRLQILPKLTGELDPTNPQKEVEQAVKLLFRMLHYSNFFGVKDIPDPQSMRKFNFDLLEIFIHLFIKKFIELFTRRAYRNYEEREGNQQFIKGKILFHQTILKNPGFQHIHYLRYNEFTDNSLLNQIFKTVIVSLLTISKVPENRKKLNLALLYLEAVQTIRLSSTIFDQVKFNRLNETYRPLFQMAKMFYCNAMPGLSQGDERTFTFLIPLNELFEYTLYQMLNRNITSPMLAVNYQTPQKYLAMEQKELKLKPDITICNRSKVEEILLVVDAKYKNPVYDSKIEAASSDIYQMLAYAIRYRCNHVCLVYPMFDENKKRGNLLATYTIDVEGRKVEIKVLQVDVKSEDINHAARSLLSSIGLEVENNKLKLVLNN